LAPLHDNIGTLEYNAARVHSHKWQEVEPA
jgi:hypothetical protein